MKSADQVFQTTRERLLKAREKDRQQLRRVIRRAGGPGAWAAKLLPGELGAACPLEWTEDAAVQETTAFYAAAGERVRQCAKCPSWGGACADHQSCIEPGTVLQWEGDRLREAPCSRWSEYTLRRSLADSGVPFAMAGHGFQPWLNEPGAEPRFAPPNDDTAEAVLEWMESVQRRDEIRPWIILTGKPNTGKTRLAIAALRNIKRAAPSLRLWYQDVELSVAPLRDYFGDRDLDDPLRFARSADALVLDSCEAQPRSIVDAFTEVLNERITENRATLICTREIQPDRDGASPLVKRFNRVRGLADVPVWTLVAKDDECSQQ